MKEMLICFMFPLFFIFTNALVISSVNGHTYCNGLQCPAGSSCSVNSYNGVSQQICRNATGHIVAQSTTGGNGQQINAEDCQEKTETKDGVTTTTKTCSGGLVQQTSVYSSGSNKGCVIQTTTINGGTSRMMNCGGGQLSEEDLKRLKEMEERTKQWTESFERQMKEMETRLLRQNKDLEQRIRGMTSSLNSRKYFFDDDDDNSSGNDYI